MWLSQDPAGFAAGDSNLYRYVGNSPTNATDPSGLQTCIYTGQSPGMYWINPNTGHAIPVPPTGTGVFSPETYKGGGPLSPIGAWKYAFDHSPTAQTAAVVGVSAAVGAVAVAYGPAALEWAFSNCFPSGTPVSTKDGLKAIQEIGVGELVWAFDLTSGKWKLCPVLETYQNNQATELVEIEVAGERIRSTRHHPFWVIEGDGLAARPKPGHIVDAWQESKVVPGRWVDAGDLKLGDVLLLKDNKPSRVSTLAVCPNSEPVYNFAVDSLHCYAVGTNAVLVHNNSALEAWKEAQWVEANSAANGFAQAANDANLLSLT